MVNIPDKETLEELNLAEINKAVVKSTFDKNPEVAQQLAQNKLSILLEKMAKRMRQVLNFMQKEVRVFAEAELETEAAWKQFIENESVKIS